MILWRFKWGFCTCCPLVPLGTACFVFICFSRSEVQEMFDPRLAIGKAVIRMSEAILQTNERTSDASYYMVQAVWIEK